MGFLTGLMQRESRASIEDPGVPLSSPNILTYIGAVQPSEAGVEFSNDAAIRLSAVWSCLRVRGEALSALPWDVLERTSSGGRRPVTDHPLTELLRNMKLREALSWHVDGWGNGYLEVIRAGRAELGDVEELRLLSPTATRAERTVSGGVMYVTIDEDSRPRAIAARNMVHVAGPGWDGVSGYSVLAHHANTIGYPLAARRAGSRLLANDSRPLGVIKVTQRLDPQEGTADAIRDKFEAHQAGWNRGRISVLGGGADYQNIGLPPEQMQFVEQMEWGLLEVARLFLTPPHKIGHLKDAGDRANVEAENLRFATDVLVPSSRRLELAVDLVCLTPGERARGMYTKVDLRGMLRGDFKSRMEGYAIGRGNGLLNADEIRALEDQNPIGGRAGQTYLVPLNLTDASLEPAPPKEPAAPAAPDAGKRLAELAPVIEDAAGRLTHREQQEIAYYCAKLRRDGWSPELEGRLEGMWRDQVVRLELAFAPILDAAGIQSSPVVWDELGSAYRMKRAGIFAELRKAAGPDRAEQADSILESWPDLRAELAREFLAAAAKQAKERNP